MKILCAGYQYNFSPVKETEVSSDAELSEEETEALADSLNSTDESESGSGVESFDNTDKGIKDAYAFIKSKTHILDLDGLYLDKDLESISTFKKGLASDEFSEGTILHGNCYMTIVDDDDEGNNAEDIAKTKAINEEAKKQKSSSLINVGEVVSKSGIDYSSSDSIGDVDDYIS